MGYKIKFTVAVIFLIGLISVLVVRSSLQNKLKNSPKQPLTQVTPTPEFLLSKGVATTPGPGNTGIYSGNFIEATIPSDKWNAAQAVDCGEEEEEELAVYYKESVDPSAKLPSGVINICVGEMEKNVTEQRWYTDNKQVLLEQVQNHLIDNVSEQSFLGQNALIFEQTRRDFTGHYEKTVMFTKNRSVYRFVWSIQTDNEQLMNSMKQKTQADYNSILASIKLKERE